MDTDVFSPPSNTHLDRPPTIGIVKTLRPRYGIRELILAFHQIADASPDAQLVIVGGGEQCADLQAMVINLRWEDNAKLMEQLYNGVVDS